MFRAIEKGKWGSTIYYDTPEAAKLAAYKSCAYIANVLGRHYSMTSQADGAITVAGDGLETITYEVSPS